MTQAVRDLLDQTQFQLGLAAGVAGAVLALLLLPVWRRSSARTPLPAVGLLVGAATLIGLGDTPRRPQLAAGLLLLAATAPVARLVRHRSVAAVASVPGAVVVALAATRPPTSVSWLAVAGAIVVVGSLVADFDSRHRRSGLGPVLFAVSAAGVYVTVPDTEAAAALLGATLAPALLGWPRCLASLGTAGAYVAVGALVAVAADGGRTLEASVVGAAACVGLLAAEPAAARVADRLGRRATRTYRPGWPIVPVVLCHALVVVVAGRVAGQASSLGLAISVVVADLILAVALAVGLFTTDDAFGEPSADRTPG